MTAVRALSAMARDLLELEGIDFLGMPRYVELQLQIPLDAQRDGVKAAGKVVEQILRRVKEVRDHERALVPGAVYSYREDTADTQPCRPKEVREVFDGYDSTGRPKFTDFVTMAIERKDNGLDEMLAGGDVVITHVTTGRVLRTAQLAEFGKTSPIYHILGQVDAGLYPLTNTDKKAAFSFQLLRGSTLEGRPYLRVHVVGAADLMDVADPSVAQILSGFQRTLDQESLRLSGKLSNDEELDEEEFVRPALQELAKMLSGRARRANRRTKHADERSQDGQRPTSKAWEDAKAVTDDNMLWDDRENTVIVIGPKGRVHVFTPAAKHVTSLMMQGSSIQGRHQQGQWRDAEPEERGEFRIALRRVTTQAEAEGGPGPSEPPTAAAVPESPVAAVLEVPVAAVSEAPVVAEPEAPVVAEPEAPVVAEPEAPVAESSPEALAAVALETPDAEPALADAVPTTATPLAESASGAPAEAPPAEAPQPSASEDAGDQPGDRHTVDRGS